MNIEESLKKIATLKVRCSSLGKIMGAGKNIGLTDKQKEYLETLCAKDKLTPTQEKDKAELEKKALCKAEFCLSQTAKTYIEGIVKEELFGYENFVSSKEMEKGNLCEQDAIDLINEVYFEDYTKNTEYKENEFISGTCDINKRRKIIDLKCPWSLLTFPAIPSEGKNEDYELQGRGYMWLYDCDVFELFYCMVDTPDHLLEYERNISIHKVSHIAPELRVTKLKFDRDTSIEEKIKEKVLECRRYAIFYANEILNKAI